MHLVKMFADAGLNASNNVETWHIWNSESDLFSFKP